MDTLRQDIHYAFRRLVQSPGFTSVALLTLALGVGANTAIFSVVNGVLLKPLPYPQPDRLVGVYHTSGGQRATMSGPNFIDVSKAAGSFENSAAISTGRAVLTGVGDPVRLRVARVSASLFNVLRVYPQLGRPFSADENTPGKTNVVILSCGLWQERFGGDPAVVGKRIQLDGIAREIVGVMPQGFSYPAEREAYLPIEYESGFVSQQRGAWYLSAIARLKPGITPQASAAEVETIGRNLARQYPDANAEVGITTMPLQDAMVEGVRRSMFVLLGAVGFVLLIACANVANLLLARAAARQSEMAVRTALGAGRGRLVRQLLTESVILALAGGIAGLLLAMWGVELLIALKPAGIPRLDAVRVDGRVMLFTLGVSLFTGVVFGLVPAFQATRDALAGTLKESGRGAVTTSAGVRVRGALVVLEMALAVMLLAGAGLLLRSFVKLQAVDPGFRPEQVLTFELSLPDARYPEDDKSIAFFDQLLPRLRSLPGVRSAGAVMLLPLSGSNFNISFTVAGRPPVPPAQEPSMEVRVVSPEYFSTVGIPIVRGRGFTDDDKTGTTPVVLISETSAREFFPGEDPIGKRITLGWGKRVKGQRVRAGGEVIGIVRDVKESALDEPNAAEIFLPIRQWPVNSMAVVVKTAVPPASISESVRTAVRAVDANLPISNVRTLDAIVAQSISQPRFYMLLLTIFAGLALALAAIGIFGVLSYAVAQRTREIGIRMALGAQEFSVIGLVVRHALVLVLSGIVAGTAAAFFVSETMRKMLFSVEPTDPGTFAVVALTLLVVAAVACYLPARRATRVDPIVALRAE
jgi:putative ABC transport system permease protein